MRNIIFTAAVWAGIVLTPIGALAGNAITSVTASFNPNPAMAGQTVTFTWGETGGDHVGCGITGVPGQPFAGGTGGSYTFTASTNLQADVLCDSDDGNSVDATATLSVNAAPAPAITSFFSTPPFLAQPGIVALHWTTSNVTSCNFGAVDGTTDVYVQTSRIFTLSCSGVGGTASKSIAVTVPIVPPQTVR